MVDPSSIGQAASQYGQNLLPAIMKWVGIGVLIFIILGALYMFWIFFQYNIIVYRLILAEEGQGDKKRHSIRAIRAIRARRVREQGNNKFRFLFSRQKSDPVPERFILPYNGILVKFASFVYDVDGELRVPSSVSFGINPHANVNFTPLPYEVRRAASLEMQEVLKEYQEDSFMSKYGSYFTVMIVVLFCLVLCGLVVWWTYNYIGGGLAEASEAAKTLGEQFREGVGQKFSPGQ